MAAVGVASFAVTYGRGEDLARARTATFCTLAFTQLFFSFACRSRARTLPELGPFSNPYLFGAIAVSALLQFAVGHPAAGALGVRRPGPPGGRLALHPAARPGARHGRRGGEAGASNGTPPRGANVSRSDAR